MAYHYTITVWGAPYIDLMMRVTIPTLMAPGNLPAFQRRFPIHLLIYTTAQDAETIRSHPGWRQLRDMVPVEILPVEGIDTRSDPYAAMTEIQKRAMADATDRHADGLILQNADACWGDGCLAFLAERLAEGVRHVHCTTFRVSLETFVPALLEQGRRVGGAVSIRPRDLLRLGLTHAHPYTASLLQNSPSFTSLPTVIADLEPGRLRLHSLHTVPLLSSRKRYDADFTGTHDWDYFDNLERAGEKLHFIEDYERFAFVEMSDHFRFINAIEPAQTLDPVAVGEWLTLFQPTLPHGGQVFRIGARLPWTQGRVMDTGGAPQGGPLAGKVDEILAAKTLYDACRVLAEAGASRSARLLACGLKAADAHRMDVWNEPFTLYAPTDESFSSWPGDWLARLIVPGRENALRGLIASLAAPGLHRRDHDFGKRVVTTASGIELALASDVGRETIGGREIDPAAMDAGPGVIRLVKGLWEPLRSFDGVIGAEHPTA